MLCLPFGSITSRMSSKILWKRFYQVIYLAGSYPQPTRQKQYFEQRKRQQQQQNSNGLESYSDKKAPCTQCPENNRSLDILSLLNLSTNGQDFTSRFSEAQGRGSSNGQHTTQNSQTALQMENENICPSEHVEIRETRNVSNHLEEAGCQQEFLFDFSSSNHDASKGNNEKDQMKMITDRKLSVVDMLGDDGQNSSSRGNLVHENHVAFSVEAGLGKVEMETPVHSPQHPTRKFAYGCPGPSKIFKGSYSSKNLNCSLEDQFHELDDMAVGGDLPTDACSLELPPYLGELHRNPKQKTMVDKECLLHDAEDFLSNDEFYDSRVEHDRFKWHEKSSFLDEKFLEDNTVSWKNWSCDLDYMRSRKCEKSDFSFEGGHMQKRRARVDSAGCFNVSGLSSPYKHQINHRYDFMTSDMTRCNSQFSETTHSSDWPSFARHDLHLLSQDSFLSHPAWREGTNNPSSNFRRHATDSRSPFSMKSNTFSGGFGMKGNINIMSDFSTHRRDDWLFEERCNTESYDGSIKASETPNPKAFHKHWAEELFDSDFNLKFCVDEHGGNFFSDEVAFSQQVSPVKEEYGHDDLFNEEKDDSVIQLQKSASTRESESVTLPAVTSTFHQHIENSHDSNYSSSKNGTPINNLESEESQVKTPEIEITPAPNAVLSPEPSEGGSSSVEMPHCHGLKECPDATQTSLQTQNEHKETEDSGPNSCKVMMLGRYVVQLL
ncbi:uncharacterized protein LOC111876526 isoform X3 [Lactuca sativa]|nr:uncharacterized protein LOC111876526 isoform X3 [Lactuca sativa]XP_042754212.1 uncharacterized protein LOC111876526 isoform X3 [Lactuca sativa]